MSEIDFEMTVIEVCQCVRLPLESVVEIVETGIVQPAGKRPDDWVFDTQMLAILKKAQRLQRDLEIDWNGVALALGLMEELEAVRAENTRLRQLLLDSL